MAASYGAQERVSLRMPRAPARTLHRAEALQEVAGILVFSALPFLSVQALADSDFGKNLRVRYM